MRECIEFPLNSFYKKYPELETSNIQLFIDTKNSDEIIDFLNDNQKTFRKILYIILKNQYSKQLYRKEEVTKKSKFMTAMKFAKGSYKGKNGRIYCKEFFSEEKEKKIVMILLLAKTEMNRKLKKRIEIMGGYDYGFSR